MVARPPDPLLAERLAALRAGFVAGLARREASILAALDAGDLESLQLALHQLAGVAGSYGFDALGRLSGLALADPARGVAALLRELRATLSSQSDGGSAV